MENDPNGMITESYNIAGITEEECRSIFFGWALAFNQDLDPIHAIKEFLKAYENKYPQHPMNKVLREGITEHNLNPSRRVRRKNRLK